VSARGDEIRRLHRARPRRRFVRGSVWALAALVAGAWLAGGFDAAGWLDARSRANAARFLSELRPWPLQGQPWDWGTAAGWAADLWRRDGARAVTATGAMSVAAIVLAGLAAGLTCLGAARNFARSRPLLPGGRPPGRLETWAWRAVLFGTRAGYVFVRAIPEYVWAFLLLAILGPVVWPLVLALALHNAGILGKLNAEVVENLDRQAPSALRALGAGRVQIAVAALYPAALPHFLLYFFYRWETCVREATVLGMLGAASLGYHIVAARAANRYDEMGFYVLAGVLLVAAGDAVSAATRALVRRA
jgi:phosphonate transport system permease protein